MKFTVKDTLNYRSLYHLYRSCKVYLKIASLYNITKLSNIVHHTSTPTNSPLQASAAMSTRKPNIVGCCSAADQPTQAYQNKNAAHLCVTTCPVCARLVSCVVVVVVVRVCACVFVSPPSIQRVFMCVYAHEASDIFYFSFAVAALPFNHHPLLSTSFVVTRFRRCLSLASYRMIVIHQARVEKNTVYNQVAAQQQTTRRYRNRIVNYYRTLGDSLTHIYIYICSGNTHTLPRTPNKRPPPPTSTSK